MELLKYQVLLVGGSAEHKRNSRMIRERTMKNGAGTNRRNKTKGDIKTIKYGFRNTIRISKPKPGEFAIRRIQSAPDITKGVFIHIIPESH